MALKRKQGTYLFWWTSHYKLFFGTLIHIAAVATHWKVLMIVSLILTLVQRHRVSLETLYTYCDVNESTTWSVISKNLQRKRFLQLTSVHGARRELGGLSCRQMATRGRTYPCYTVTAKTTRAMTVQDSHSGIPLILHPLYMGMSPSVPSGGWGQGVRVGWKRPSMDVASSKPTSLELKLLCVHSSA